MLYQLLIISVYLPSNPIIQQKLKYFLTLLFLVYIILPGYTQCTFDVNDTIAANTDFFIQGSVSGLVNDDLSVNQSLCGVELRFKHEFIGNLQIELISPSGQKILLVGPPLVGNFTNGSEWNIDFVRCMDIPAPDPGQPNTFDNGAPWVIGGSYTGSYFPYNGCLEDINSGPANGIWQLHIINGPFYTGNLISFGLLFCDPAGISCIPCDANAGQFDTKSFIFCDNDVALTTFVPPVSFGQQVPDATEYNYDYVLTVNNGIIDIAGSIDWTLLSPGTYNIYGLSYLKIYEAELRAYAGDAYQSLKSRVQTTQLCAALTTDSIELVINRSYNLPEREVILCSGDTFHLSNKIYTTSGIIRDTLTSINGCDSIVSIDLKFTDIHIDILADTIDCVNMAARLDTANFTMDIPGGIVLGYEWRDETGNPISNNGNVMVNDPGNYSLNISILYGGLLCNYSISARVESQVVPPVLPDIDPFNPCADTRLRLVLLPDSLRDVSQWSFTGNPILEIGKDTIYVTWSQPGVYEVCVWGLNECGSSDTLCRQVNVGIMTVWDIDFDSLTCDGSFEIHVNAGGSVDLEWKDGKQSANMQVNSDGSIVAGNIIAPDEEALLTYEGSVNGCDVIGNVQIKTSPDVRYVVRDTAFCGAGTYGLPVEVSGLGGTLFYRDDGGAKTVSVAPGNNIISVTVANDATVFIDSLLTDYSTCFDIRPDTISIRIEDPPESFFPDTIRLCNGFSPDGPPKYYLPDLVSSGERSGVWNFSNIPGVQIINDSIDLTNIAPGIYTVNFKTSSAVLPCFDQNYSLVFKIISCTCLPPALVDLKSSYTFCNDYGLLNLDSLSSSAYPLTWYDITDGNKTALDGNKINLDASVSGSLTLMLETTQDWERACPDSMVIGLKVQEMPYAGDDHILDLCRGDDYTVDLDTILTNVRNHGDWIADRPDYPGFSQAFNPSTNVLNTQKLRAGTYIMHSIVMSKSVCPSDTAQLQINIHALPGIEVSGKGYLDCADMQSGIFIDGPTISDLNISWLYGGTVIHQSFDKDSLIVDRPGAYEFALESTVTGCRDTIAFFVENNADSISHVGYDLLGNCNAPLADLFLSMPEGGSPPFKYSLDNGPFTTYMQFYGIVEGAHHLVVEDSKRCRYEIGFEVDSRTAYNFFLGEDTTIIAGDRVYYNIQFPSANIMDMEIRLNDKISGIPDTSGYLSPLETTVLYVRIRDKGGCIYEDSRTIFVEAVSDIFVPNVFSPNGDGYNDVFFVPQNARIESIEELNVYDRWGNHVFERKEIPAGVEEAGWDGTFQGQKMNPAVFVYFIKYRTLDRQVLIKKGEITLVR